MYVHICNRNHFIILSHHLVNPTVSAGRRQPHVSVAIQLSTVLQRGCNNHWYHVLELSQQFCFSSQAVLVQRVRQSAAC